MHDAKNRNTPRVPHAASYEFSEAFIQSSRRTEDVRVVCLRRRVKTLSSYFSLLHCLSTHNDPPQNFSLERYVSKHSSLLELSFLLLFDAFCASFSSSAGVFERIKVVLVFVKVVFKTRTTLHDDEEDGFDDDSVKRRS